MLSTISTPVSASRKSTIFLMLVPLLRSDAGCGELLFTVSVIVAVEVLGKSDCIDQTPNTGGKRKDNANNGYRPIQARHAHHKDQTRHKQSDVYWQKILFEQFPAAPVKTHHRPKQECRPVEAGLLPGVDLPKLGQVVVSVFSYHHSQRIACRLCAVLHRLGCSRRNSGGRQ